MKTVKYKLPDGINIHTIVDWCSANSIPMVFMDGIRLLCRRECKVAFLDGTKTIKTDLLILRECDYEIVRLRF